jgi:hypothetical protein
MRPSDDPILKNLADLPEVPLDAATSDRVQRRARIALVDAREAPHPTLMRLSLAWSTAILPTILLGTGAVYTWGAVKMIGRIFVS